MNELQEIAYQIINKADAATLQKWKDLKSTYNYLLETEKDFMEVHTIYDLAVEICDILFIAQKRE